MSDEELLEFMEEEGGGLLSIKTLIIDVTDNWGYGFNTGIRELVPTLLGSKLPLVQADYSAGATTERAGEEAVFCFDTSLSLIGGSAGTSWTTPNFTTNNQRLYCNYNDLQFADGLMLNNWHTSGTVTNVGAKNVKIYTTASDFLNTVFEEAVPGGTLIFDGVLPEHAPTNTIQDFALTLIP